MKFDEYIQNPMGIANSVYSHRTMYRNLYQEKLDKILVREAGNIEYTAYKVSRKVYMLYIKIPSEVVPKFYYDVVIQFIGNHGGGSDLSAYDVKFYSNDPSFVFTFAYAFKKNNMFITALSDKMSKRALTEKAKEKNPKAEVGYVKSLYFAYLYMKKKGLFNTVNYVEKLNLKALKREIEHADKKIEERQNATTSDRIKNRKVKNDTTQAQQQTKSPEPIRINTAIKKIPAIKKLMPINKNQNSKIVKTKTVKRR